MKFTTFTATELSKVTNGQASCAGVDTVHSIELGMRIMTARVEAHLAIVDDFNFGIAEVRDAMERPTKLTKHT